MESEGVYLFHIAEIANAPQLNSRQVKLDTITYFT